MIRCIHCSAEQPSTQVERCWNCLNHLTHSAKWVNGCSICDRNLQITWVGRFRIMATKAKQHLVTCVDCSADEDKEVVIKRGVGSSDSPTKSLK